VLERSVNGRDYYSITTVRAAGNANTISTYNYTDSNIYKLGMPYIYYRIKEVDRDGKTLMSAIVMLRIDNILTIAAIPNPVVEKLGITITAASSMRTQLTITNAEGKLIVNDAGKPINAGTTNISYNAASWAPGVYFVKVMLSNGNSQVIKVLKQ
jgi:trimeric autotransporter adhesin